MVISFLLGVVLALVMYFAWLTPTPEEMRDAGYEPDYPSQFGPLTCDARLTHGSMEHRLGRSARPRPGELVLKSRR
jgi:hypothetical protein